MALLERVATLLRANLNDLIDRAEDPPKMLKQLILDMENQLLQVKTQVAIALADEHLLERKQTEHADAATNWQRKAGLAVSKQQDDLARAALSQQISQEQMATSFAQQLADQRAETKVLRAALAQLQQRLQETQSRCELLAVEYRRARLNSKKAGATASAPATLARVRGLIDQATAETKGRQALLNNGGSALSASELEERFTAIEREDQIEELLRALKAERSQDTGPRTLPSPA